MIRKRKIKEGSIPRIHPGLPNKESITVLELTEALDVFFRDYLRDAMTLEVDGKSYDRLIISSDHLAYLIKLIGEYGAETEVLNIKVTIGKDFRLETTFKHGEPDLDTLTNFAAACNKAGFSMEIDGGHVIFSTKIHTDFNLSVYATNSKRVLYSFKTVFFYN